MSYANQVTGLTGEPWAELGGQAGASDSNSLGYKLADSSVSKSPPSASLRLRESPILLARSGWLIGDVWVILIR